MTGIPLVAGRSSPRRRSRPARVPVRLLAETLVETALGAEGVGDDFGELDERVVRVLAWLDEMEQRGRWHEVTLEGALRRAHLSSDRFRHLFSEALGSPWRTYLVWRRALVGIRSSTRSSTRAGGVTSRPTHAAVQAGAIPRWLHPIAPRRILHSWVEVSREGRWIALEGFIPGRAYLQALQTRFPQAVAFTGYGAATLDLRDPPVRWRGEPTYIQKQGIVDDFGVFDHPDDLYRRHGTNLTGARRVLFQHVFRHAMNRTVARIRATNDESATDSGPTRSVGRAARARGG